MKALSLWQPWASLIAWGEKKIETRHWDTRYRGLLAIHAAKRRFDSRDMSLGAQRFLWDVFTSRNATVFDLPYGAVLCIVRLNSVERITPIMELIVPLQEFHFGNYAPGRYAWHLELVEVFDKPVPAVGRQGLWNWERPNAD